MRFFLIVCVVALLAVSCRTSRITSTESDRQTVSIIKDTSWSKETVKVDTFRVSRDTASVVIPERMLADLSMPLQEKHSGRATVKVQRTPTGIIATASCDSLEHLLLQRTLETYRLQKELASERLQKSVTDKQTLVIYKIPWGWIIPALIVLAGILVFTFLKIKKFIL